MNLSLQSLSIKIVWIRTNVGFGIPLHWGIKISTTFLKLFMSFSDTFSWNTLMKKLVHEKFKQHRLFLPVAFDTLSRTFGWPLLFYASFSKYSNTFIKRCFVWLLRCFPWKVYVFNLRGRFVLSTAFVCSWSHCGTQRCHFVHIKRKASKLHNHTLLHVLMKTIM